MAGVGNVYRAEILFQLGIHPDRPGKEMTTAELERLWSVTVELMTRGVKYNRIITVDRRTAGKPLSRLNGDERLLCYKKRRCRICNRSIKKWTLGARTMYACNHCQK